jgi:hypothetical protein
MNNPLFDMAKNAPSSDWVKLNTVTEEELLNSTQTDSAAHTETHTDPPPVQGENVFSNPVPPVQGNGVNIGAFFNEDLATELMDTVLSGLGVWGCTALGKKATRNQMSATEKEKEKIKPVMRAVLDTFNVQITNPFEALFYSVLAIYGTKVGLVYVTGESVEKRPKNAEYDEVREVKRRHTGKQDCKCPKCISNG